MANFIKSVTSHYEYGIYGGLVLVLIAILFSLSRSSRDSNHKEPSIIKLLRGKPSHFVALMELLLFLICVTLVIMAASLESEKDLGIKSIIILISGLFIFSIGIYLCASRLDG